VLATLPSLVQSWFMLFLLDHGFWAVIIPHLFSFSVGTFTRSGLSAVRSFFFLRVYVMRYFLCSLTSQVHTSYSSLYQIYCAPLSSLFIDLTIFPRQYQNDIPFVHFHFLSFFFVNPLIPRSPRYPFLLDSLRVLYSYC